MVWGARRCDVVVAILGVQQPARRSGDHPNDQ